LAAEIRDGVGKAHFVAKLVCRQDEGFANFLIIIRYADHFEVVLVILFFVRDFSDLVSDTILEMLVVTFASGYENDTFVYLHVLRLIRFFDMLTSLVRVLWHED
jgi:hypothetical protein